MKLTDLSDNNRRILVVLKDIQCGGRRHIADLAGLEPNQVSPALSRLEALGYVERPSSPGMGWTMSDTGYALFGQSPPLAPEPKSETDAGLESEPELVPENPFPDSCGPEYAEPEPEPVVKPVPGPYATGKSADLMVAMEIELALEQVRGRLRVATIPAREARIYRGILEVLLSVLANELRTITAMVDAHG